MALAPDLGADEVPVKEHEIYYAMLAEQAERYDEMCEHMRTASLIEDELNEKERTLLAVAFKQAVGARRSAWRVVCNREKHELGRGNDDTASCAKKFRLTLESEIQDKCTNILNLLSEHLIPKASSTEARVQYYKAQGDYQRYISEISDNVYRRRATQLAQQAYEEGTRIAEQAPLPVTDHYRLGLALNHAVFYYECLKSPNEACRIARKAFEDAVREIDTLEDKAHKTDDIDDGDPAKVEQERQRNEKNRKAAQQSTMIIQLLRDNLTLWTGDDAGGGTSHDY